ncbi:MAG: hypothetical protein PVJ57_15970 [Phycisphaerae bacterium]|jgi:hypothetical protein
MNRILTVGLMALFVLPCAAWAQTDTSEQTPSTWVGAARSRHQLLQQARVTNARQGEFAGTTEGLTEESTSSSGSSLSSLLDVVSGLSGSLGSTSDLGSLLGLLGSDTTDTTTTTGGDEEWTIEDLLALGEAMGGIGKPINSSTDDTATTAKSTLATAKLDTAQEYETRDASGAIGRLPKIDATSQSSDTEQSFTSRLTETLATTFFSSLAIGFQSSTFINFLKDQLRPVFFPTDDDSTDNTSGDGNSIEDQNSSGNGGSTNSIV